MRFLQSEHDAFKALIDSSSFDYASFTFHKKKGWLRISQPSKVSTFRFHRKEESSLDNNGKWIDTKSYFIEVNKEKKEVQVFDEVIVEFKTWLESSIT